MTNPDVFLRNSVPPTCHLRSRSTISSHSREAKERIQEFSRLRRARYLIDAIFIGEDLLANGSDVEILSLKRIILKRLKFLGVAVDAQGESFYKSLSLACRWFTFRDDCGATRFSRFAAQRFNGGANEKALRALHSGIYHCCTFCSSGGKKEATCACSGTMPGMKFRSSRAYYAYIVRAYLVLFSSFRWIQRLWPRASRSPWCSSLVLLRIDLS